jgi:CDP-diacylglycerol--serine O-phosphatidyltransferase
MHRFFDAANAITLVGLTAAVLGGSCSLRGRLAWAAALLVVSGLCDLFDGFVARKLTRTDVQKTFGARLDTIVDVCAFGMAPSVLLQAAGLSRPWELVVVVVFVACAAWRLAYFEAVGLSTEPGGKRTFTGLPTTFTALAIPTACLAGFHSTDALRLALTVTAAGLAVAMVSPVKVPKPGGVWYGILSLVALGLIVTFVVGAEKFPAT